jgi:PKD repeat protein
MKIYSHTTKKLLGCAAGLLLGLSAWTPLKSQVHYHVNEDFSSFPNSTNPFPVTGWSNGIDYGDFNFDFWDFGNPGGRSVSAPGDAEVAIFDANYYSFNWDDEDVSLMTPEFDTRGYDEVWVKFDHQFEYNGSGNWQIEAFDGRSWNYVASGSTQTNWQTDSFDISSDCANLKNARFRFRWMGTWQNNMWWMVDNVQVYSPTKSDNVTVTNAKFAYGLAGNTADNVVVTVRNLSDVDLTNIPVKAVIEGTIAGSPYNNTVSTVYTGTIKPGDDVDVNIGSINTSGGANLAYKAFTEFPGDPSTDNDTFFVKSYDILGVPAAPTPPVFFHCGAGRVLLDGGIQKGNVGYWHRSANPFMNSLFSTSNVVNTDILTPPSSQTVFLSQARRTNNLDLTTNFNGNFQLARFKGITDGGMMFTINPTSNLEIDSFGIHMPNTNYTDVTVYYKTGSYDGFETDPSAWTMLGKVNVQGKGGGNETYINVDDMLVPAGQQYSFFIYSEDDMLSTSGTTPYYNEDMSIDGGTVIFNNFGASQNDFTWNGTVYYRNYTESNMVPVTGVVKEAPANSGFAKNTTFKGFFRDGDTRTPDLVAVPDNIIYDIVTPKGFLDKDHGSAGTWEVTSVDFVTVNGTSVPKADYTVTNPSNAGKGKISYTPSAAYVDSTLKISITIKRNDNQCDTMIERYIYVAPRPDPKFTINNGCANEEVSLSNSSSILKGTLSYLWKFGDGTTSTYINPAKKYNTAGKYTVKLIISSDLGYNDSVSKTIDIFATPDANFTFTNACEGTALQMTHTGTLPTGTPTYGWDFGTSPATTATTATTSKLYNAPGIYNVTLKVSVNGCANTVSKNVTQAPRVTPDYTFTATQCDNGAVDFTNNTIAPTIGSVNYLWKFGDGKESTSTSASHTYNKFTTYNAVLVTSTTFGCKDSVIKQVTLRQSPAASFTNTSAKCNNEAITFTNSSTVPAGSTNNYVWDFGDGKTSSDQDPIHQFDAPGTYTISLKSLSTNGCEGKIETMVTINLKPSAGFEAKDVCKGSVTNFVNGSFSTDNASLTYDWTFDNSTSSTLTNPSVTYGAAGTYNVSLKATHPNGCVDVVTTPVKVFALPIADINSNSRKTGDGAMEFKTNASGTGYTYLWLFGDGGKSYDQNPTYLYEASGLMIVHLTVTSGDGCTSSAADTILINKLGVDNASGIANSVSVYPNPSAGKFVVDCTNAANDINNISVVDMMGRTIINNVEVNNAGIAEVDLTTVAAGIYYLNISGLTGTHTVKLNVSR